MSTLSSAHLIVCTDLIMKQLPHVLRLLTQDQLTNVGESKVNIVAFLPSTKLTKLFSSYFKGLSKIFPAGKRMRIHEIHSLLN